MAGQGNPAADKLRAFLRELKPGARALLIAELERGLLQGTNPAGAELILAELRRSLRDGQSSSGRFGDPARLFFQPVEPFLVDDGPDHKHHGRIARAALEPLWLWIGNSLIPEEAKGLHRAGRARAHGGRHRPGRASGPNVPGPRGGAHRTDARRRRRQGASPSQRPARHLARVRRCAGAARHPQFAGRAGDAWHPTAGPHQCADGPGARKREGAIGRFGVGESPICFSIRSCW